MLWSENKGNIHRLCVQVSEVKYPLPFHLRPILPLTSPHHLSIFFDSGRVQASRIFIVVELATGGEV